MKVSPPELVTPIHLKLQADTAPPEDRVAYLMTSNGLFLCRQHPFFSSSVPVKEWPAELAAHKPFLQLKYPKIPQRLLERVVGFFARIGARYCAEAAVLLVWNKTTEAMEVVVPEQRSTVSVGWEGRRYPIDVAYDVPPLTAERMLIGDIHSHVDGPAYASFTDKEDERHRPGLHVVVGRVQEEPPEFYLAATVDGTRFEVHNPDLLLAGYHRRRSHEVPQSWIDQLTVKTWSPQPYPRYGTGDALERDRGEDGASVPEFAKFDIPSSRSSLGQPSASVERPTPPNPPYP